jgi:hypothetical protein
MIIVTKRPFDKSFSGNPIHYELTSETAAANPAIYFEIRLMFALDQGGTWSEVAVLPYYPTNGVAQINVQDLVHAQLSPQVPTFEADEITIQKVVGQVGWFYVEFREITPGSDAPDWATSEWAFLRKALWGGINYFKWGGNNFWVNHFDTVKPFFTWQRSGRPAASMERMFLMWVNFWTLDTETLVQRTRINYTDGTTHTIDQAFPAGGYFDAFFVPSGMAQLNLATFAPTKKIHYWVVQIVDTNTGTALSEPFRFTLDNDQNYNAKTLHYRNSLGGFDSVRVRGVIEEKLEYSYQEQDRATMPDYFTGHVIAAQRVFTQTVETLVFSGDVGHLSKDDQERLRDLQVKRECYQQNGNKWFPVSILTKSLKLRTSGDQVFSMPIEWSLAYDGSTHYTPDNMNFGDGVATSNVCLAFLTGLAASVDLSGTDAMVTINYDRNDPQAASSVYRWRVVGHRDWVESTYGAVLQFDIEKDLTVTVEMQPMCNNGVFGGVSSVEVYTGEYSTIRNNSNATRHFVLWQWFTKIGEWDIPANDEVQIIFGDYPVDEFTLEVSPATQINSWLQTGDGTVYNPTNQGINNGVATAQYFNVNVVDGFYLQYT